MAALLPGIRLSVGSKMEVLVDGNPTISTANREAVLCKENPNSVAVTYNDLLQMNQMQKRDLTKEKDVIYIYHNVIDAIGDKLATENKVFKDCTTAIDEISNIVRVIVNDLSGARVLITADHGFLYTYKPLEESQKISMQTFSGDTYEIGRRYALVPTQTTADYLLPVATDYELGGVPVKGYAPQDIVRIKRPGGGENYVHGGISLQEMVVPVIVYQGMRTGYKNYVEVKSPGLILISESRRVSNMVFSLNFFQKVPVKDKVQKSDYRICFTDEDGTPVSDIQTIFADRSSVNDLERVFRLKFTLKQMPFDPSKVYRLVISNGIDTPEEAEFHFDLAFADDFGFDM
jgi:hypothetical protein